MRYDRGLLEDRGIVRASIKEFKKYLEDFLSVKVTFETFISDVGITRTAMSDDTLSSFAMSGISSFN